MNDLDLTEQLEGQMSIFDIGKTPYKVTKPIRLIETFAGIGSQSASLRNIGADFTRWKVVEFDKYAVNSYNAVHSTDFPVLDITKIHAEDLEIVEREKYCYILFYSFPCTDISLAGTMKGYAEGSGTRSSLLWEIKRIIEELDNELPQILICENVPQLHSKANMPHFQKWLDYLYGKGYSSYWKDLNAKDFGLPQSRNRTFIVSILGDYTYEFPKGFPLKKRMRDYLETNPDPKLYLKSDKAKDLIDKLIKGGKLDASGTDLVPRNVGGCHELGRMDNSQDGSLEIANRVYADDGCSPCLNAHASDTVPKVLEVQKLCSVIKETGQHNCKLFKMGDEKFLSFNDASFYAIDCECASTLTARYYKGLGAHGNNMVLDISKVDVKQATKDGYISCNVGGVADLNYVSSKTRRGRVIENGEICPTLTTENIPSVIEPWVWELDGELYLIRIRKLSPCECWLLMGFSKDDYLKASAVCSWSQLYKQAGNSICVPVLEHIFKQLF